MHDNLILKLILATVARENTDPVIPERDRIWFPLKAYLAIVIFANLMKEEAQDCI